MKFAFFSLLMLCGSIGLAASADKVPVPTAAEQIEARARVKGLFKTPPAKAGPAAHLELADKLFAIAGEEKESPAARYVLLNESIKAALKGGDIERTVKAAVELNQEFNAPQLKDTLAKAFVEHIGAKDLVEECLAIAVAELDKPGDTKGQAELAKKWLDIGKTLKSDSRLAAFRRSRSWSIEALSSPDLKGLARTEAEKNCADATAEIEKADARAGRFTLFEGKWLVTFDNKYVHEYVISSDGSVKFDQCINPDGVKFVKKEEQAAKLIRRGGSVLLYFAGTGAVEKLSLEHEKMIDERFANVSAYPKNPINKGTGLREK